MMTIHSRVRIIPDPWAQAERAPREWGGGTRLARLKLTIKPEGWRWRQFEMMREFHMFLITSWANTTEQQ